MISRSTLIAFYKACGYDDKTVQRRVEEYMRLQEYHEILLDREDITQNNLKEKRK